jgi:hypothetical protein
MAILLFLNAYYQNWNKPNKIIEWDVNSYYAYLPMAFVYHDMSMGFMDNTDKDYKAHYWPHTMEDGTRVVVTTMGMSYMYAPFFLAWHGIAQLTGYTGDEFSPPYKIALILSCLFYFMIGLIFLRKVLLQYYSETVTAIVLLALVFGTNLLHYVSYEPTMSHAYSFSLFSVFLYVLIRFLRKPGIRYAMLSGGLAGLIVLIRPSNIIIILLFLLWEVRSPGDLWNRTMLYIRKAHLTSYMILAFVVVWVPQFLYWYYLTGSILINTYGELGGNFFLGNPQIWHTLFSYRKGWLVYTPLMVLAIIGLYFLYKQHRQLFFPVLIFMLLNIYVVSSWWCWWYGGSFGLRSFIDMYGLMALPLAAFISILLKRKSWLKWAGLFLIALFIYYNIFQTIQFKRGILHFVAMSKTSYWASFHDMTPPQKFYDNLVFPDYPAAHRGEYYPETEIPRGLERQVGMRGWEYLEVLKDSIRNNPERFDINIPSNTNDSINEGSIHNKGMDMFRRWVADYNNAVKNRRD